MKKNVHKILLLKKKPIVHYVDRLRHSYRVLANLYLINAFEILYSEIRLQLYQYDRLGIKSNILKLHFDKFCIVEMSMAFVVVKCNIIYNNNYYS